MTHTALQRIIFKYQSYAVKITAPFNVTANLDLFLASKFGQAIVIVDHNKKDVRIIGVKEVAHMFHTTAHS
jgi:hypothetical protein